MCVATPRALLATLITIVFSYFAACSLAKDDGSPSEGVSAKSLKAQTMKTNDEVTQQLNLVHELILKKQISEATRILKAGQKNSFANVSYAWELQARVHQARDEFSQGLAAVRKAAQLDPLKPELPIIEGYFLLKLNKPLEAVRSYTHCLQQLGYEGLPVMVHNANALAPQTRHQADSVINASHRRALGFNTYRDRAKARIMLKDYAGCLDDLNKATQIENTAETAYQADLIRLECLMAQQNWKELEKLGQKLKQCRPNSNMPDIYLAAALFQLGKYKESIPYWQSTCKSAPSPAHSKGYGWALLLSGEPAKAEKILTKAIEQDPGDEYMLLLRAEARMQQTGRLNDGLSDLAQLNRRSSKIAYLKPYAAALCMSKQSELAQNLCSQRLAEEQKKKPPSPELQARILSIRAESKAFSNNWKGAIDDLRGIEFLNRSLSAQEQCLLITALTREHQKKSALEQCNQALAKFPNAESLRRLALKLHKNSGDLKSAIADISSLVDQNASDAAELLQIQAQLHEHDGNLDGAIGSYTLALKRAVREKHHILLARAELLAKSAKFDAALADIEQSTTLDREDPAAYYLKADVYDRMGKEQLAAGERKKGDELISRQSTHK